MAGRFAFSNHNVDSEGQQILANKSQIKYIEKYQSVVKRV